MIIYSKKKPKIKKIKAKEILDSRGDPTLEVEVETNFGNFSSSVPSGASKGKYEALELRNGEKRYFGKGVLKAVEKVEKIISKKLKGENPINQKRIDQILIELDGTKNKSKLGGNSICGVSLACCRAGAGAKKIPLYLHIAQLIEAQPQSVKLPRPAFNIINGGLHAGNDLDFQEFMVCPKKRSFSQNLRMGVEIYHQLKKILEKKYGKSAINVGDEGGFAPPIKFPQEAIELILKASKALNYEREISIFLDVASSQFFKNEKYQTKFGKFEGKKLAKYYLKLIRKYPLESIEDPFEEDDFESWSFFKKMTKIQILGDDLLATNLQRIKIAKEKNLCNAILIKINQVGTVSEALEAVNLAKSFNWKIMVSHRSGETTDDFSADFAVGVLADFVKFGAPARGERIVKYNRLLKIESEVENLRSKK